MFMQRALLDLAEQHVHTVMPGFTHLQVAQPISFGHHLMAYFEMLKRDVGRLSDCRKRVNQLPLGAAALAGTSLSDQSRTGGRTTGFEGYVKILWMLFPTGILPSNSVPARRSS